MPHTRVNLAAGAPVAPLGFTRAYTRADTRRCAGDAPALPSAAALSDELKNATQDVEAVLREDRQLERQRDFRGVVGVFQVQWLCAARVMHAPAASADATAQGVGVRLFAVSVAKLLLLAAVFSCASSGCLRTRVRALAAR